MHPFLPNLMRTGRLMFRPIVSELIQSPLLTFRLQLCENLARREPF